MCLHMAVQGGFHSKTLPTFITLVWSFSCMDPNVPTHLKRWIQKRFSLMPYYQTMPPFPDFNGHSGLCKLHN